MPNFDLAATKALIGRSHVSGWISVDQSLIDRYAEVSGDRQFIHIDPERAARTPFGGTIAHGVLVLALVSQMQADAGPPRPEGVVVVNYGFDRIRFVSPVRSGSRVRGSFTLAAIEEKRPGQFQLSTDVAVEIEGAAKPAMTAVWLVQFIVAAP